MRTFIIKRLLMSIVILFFVMLIIFTIMRSLPTSYVESIARQRATMPGSASYTEWVERLNAVYGFDKGILAGLFTWLGNILKGDFGDSWEFGVPVIQKFTEVIWYSFFLSAIAFIGEFLIGIPLGIISAKKQYSKTDYAITVFALIGISLPGFFFATILKLVFSMNLGWFDLYGAVGRMHKTYGPFRQMLDYLWHYILPAATLIIISIGGIMRYTRTNMLEVLNSDYIRTARAKGLSEKKVINYHAFRNTLIPIITMVGSMIPGLFSGAMITEQLFQIPGIGYTGYLAMTKGDIPFTMFYLSFIAVLTLLGTLIADILYAVVDPRVRVS